MVRLDADLLAKVPSQLDCLSDRQLALRGYKISAIENLGVTRDQIDSLDLTDNSISSLSNFPLLRRLAHILISNNPIRTISPSLSTSLPNLTSLTLANSNLAKDALGTVGEVLGNCKKLQLLVLRGCPMEVENGGMYRNWMVYKIKSLRSLDYERVREKERTHSLSLFQTSTGSPTPLATSISTASPAPQSTLAATFEPGGEVTSARTSGKAGRLLSKEEKDRVRAAIEAAESVEEIRRLQRMLGQGFVPTEKDLKELAKRKVASSNGAEMDEE